MTTLLETPRVNGSADEASRTMLPFRVIRGRGAVFLEFDHAVDTPLGGGRRTMPFQVQGGQPVITPILRLMELYCALEDQVSPMSKQVEQLTAENETLKRENHRLEKSAQELRRQLEVLKKQQPRKEGT